MLRRRRALRPIVLVGFMGCGKSTVGPVLARLLDLPFLDLDQVVVGTAGKSVERIFRDHGEPRFRQLEAEAFRLAVRRRAVVAAGGGLVESASNRSLLRAGAVVVWLDASLQTCLARGGSEPRPLLGRGPTEVRRRYRERRRWYARADLHVRSDRGDPEAVARRIVRRLGA